MDVYIRGIMMVKGGRFVSDHSKWKWVVVMCGFFLCFLTDGVRFSFGLTYKELLEEFNEGKGATAGIGSLMFAMMNFSGTCLLTIIINIMGIQTGDGLE